MSIWFKNLTMRGKILASNSAAIALLIIFAAIIYDSIDAALERSAWVTHTQKAISTGHLLSEELLNLETGQRGFLITGDEEFLEPYTQSLSKFTKKMHAAKILVSDNPSQVKRLDKIENLARKWIENAGKPSIKMRKNIKKGAATYKDLEKKMSEDLGMNIRDHIRVVLNGMDQAFSKSNHHKGRALVISIAKSMADQEAGQRGFLVTGKDEYLEPFIDGQKNLRKHMDELSSILYNAYNRNQMHEDIEKAEQLTESWITNIGAPYIQLRRDVDTGIRDLAEIKTTVNKKIGKSTMDKLRIVLERIKSRFVLSHNETGAKEVIEVLKSIIDIETGERGFLITGNDDFLDSYVKGKEELKGHFTDIRKIVDNAFVIEDMTEKLEVMRTLTAEWLAQSAKPEIELRREINKTTYTIEDISSSISKKMGKTIMDELRVHLAAFIDVEKTLMAKRRKKGETSSYNTVLIVVFGVIFAIFIIIFIAWFTSKAITTPLSRLVKASDSIAGGDLSVKVEIDSIDEIGKLAESFRRMAANLGAANDKQEQFNWLSSSRANLDDTIRGVQELGILTQKTVNFLSKLLDAKVAAFYLADKDNPNLFKFYAGYACEKTHAQYAEFESGEGLIGQAAKEKRMIFFNELPENFVAPSITSALGEVRPNSIIVAPIVYEDKTLGALEIASTSRISELSIKYLNQITNGLGIAINTAISNKRLKELLEESETMSEELSSQQENLRQSNEELLESESRLKAQQEELRAANEELQESESKLKSQQEELRASNEELQESESKLKSQQEELQASNESLEEKTRDLQAQQEEIRTKNILIEDKAKDLEISSKYKSEFLANMSHELRTPLNSILLLSKFLSENQEKTLNHEQVEMAENISLSGTELLNLIDDILDLAKIESGKTELRLEETPLRGFCDYVERNFRRQSQEKGLELNINISPDMPEVIRADRQRVEQVIKNFISNSLKFTKKGGITFEVKRPGPDADLSESGLQTDHAIAISVADTGIGVPKDHQKLIFEAFKQADGSTVREFGGTGLGLSISRELAHLMGGEIHLESEEGKGSVFTMYVPEITELSGRKKESPAPPTMNKVDEPDYETALTKVKTKHVTAVAEPVEDDRDNLTAGKRTLLIIEDDLKFAKILKKLGNLKEYSCLLAPDGETGLEMANKYLPSAIILDIVLPNIDGWIVMDKLKKNPKTRHIPVHIVSAEENRRTALKIGAIGFLRKPISKEDLDESFKLFDRFISNTPKRLLLIEDDKIASNAIVKLLGNGDITISKASSGKEAFNLLNSEQFDCIVLDMGLPDMTGFDLLHKIKLEKSLADVPIIVYTGKELSKKTEQELEEFANSIIIKGAKSPERLLDEVSLFLHRVEAKLPKEKQKMIRMLHEEGNYFKDKTVLLADDDMRNVFALKSLLAKQGLNIVVAPDGEECLKLLDENQNIDLVLMDIMMPKMDGYEAMQKIRKQDKFAALPIIALTAKAMMEDRAKCIEAGANDYLTKPVDMDKLVSLLRVWLYH